MGALILAAGAALAGAILTASVLALRWGYAETRRIENRQLLKIRGQQDL